MKHLFSLLLFSCLMTLTTAIHAKDSQPKTVLDYFNLLPDKYFEDPIVRKQWIHHKSTITDIPNGYLFLQGDGAQSSLTVCLFKKADASYIIGVHSESSDNNDLNFYRYHAGQWQDITQQTLPNEITADYLHQYADGAESNYAHNLKMPRTGTSIIIKDANVDKKIAELIWHKEQGVFTLKK